VWDREEVVQLEREQVWKLLDDSVEEKALRSMSKETFN